MGIFRFLCLLALIATVCSCVSHRYPNNHYDGKNEVIFVITHCLDSAYTENGNVNDNYFVLFANYLPDTTIRFGIKQPNRIVPLHQKRQQGFFIVSQHFGLSLYIDGEWYFVDLSPEYPYVIVSLSLVEGVFDRNNFEVDEKIRYCVRIEQFQKRVSAFEY